MKRIILFFSVLTICDYCFAQISTISVAEKMMPLEIVETTYDSTVNCPQKNFALLVGQEVYVLPRSKYNHEEGYKGFKTAKFNVKSDKETAKRYGNPSSYDKNKTKAEDLENKVFIIVDFEQSDDKYPTYCFYLKEKNNPSNACKYIFKYESSYNQTFATMKHYSYLKEQCIGKNFYLSRCCLPETDSQTGQLLLNRDAHSWICKDIIISPKTGRLTMLLRYEDSETYLIENVCGWANVTSIATFMAGESTSNYPAFVTIAYTQEAWNENIEKYGEYMMWQVLSNKIVVGMPYELVLKSIGRPTSTDVASSGTQLYYEIDIHNWVTTGTIPFQYYQNGKRELHIYLDEKGVVTGWH